MDEIILIGAGGHARSCIEVVELTGKFKIAGLIEKNNVSKKETLGYPIIGNDNDLPRIRSRIKYALIALGQIRTPDIRLKLFNYLSELEYNLPSIISPRSHISKYSKINNGTIIMHDVIINAHSQIGKNCIINNKVLIEHDVDIKDNCHIATGSIINGGVSINSQSFIGSGVITKESINIGSNCIIGAGVVIKKNIDSNTIIK